MYEVNLVYEGKLFPNLRFAAAVKDIKDHGLKEAKDFVENNVKKAVNKNGIETSTLTFTIFDDQRAKASKSLGNLFNDNPNVHWTIEEITESQAPAQKEDLKDVIEFARQMEQTGAYVVPTVEGLHLVIITELPANQELCSRIMSALQDANCNVSEKNITSLKGNPGKRLTVTKAFPQGSKPLEDIDNTADSIINIISGMVAVVDIEKAAKLVNDKLNEAVKQLSW